MEWVISLTGDLYVAPQKDVALRRKANQWDREYLASFVKAGHRTKVVANDEYLPDGSLLITVTNKAWEEMKVLG